MEPIRVNTLALALNQEENIDRNLYFSHNLKYFSALQIYTVETGTPVKKCKSYKYLPYTFIQCRSVDITVNHCKSVLHFSTVLGAVIKCEQYSGITVESGTHVKSVKITLNIFAV